MPCDFSSLPSKNIKQLQPYIPGLSIEALKKQLNKPSIIKLASNENPLGCSPEALKALSALTPEQLSNYPDPANSPLHQALAKKHQIHPNQLLISNGSEALIPLLINTFALHNSKHILTHQFAFSAYAIQAQTLGVEHKTIPVHQDFTVNPEALINAFSPETALVFLANPNNPTGLLLSDKIIEALLQALPENTLFVLDQAYIDYLPSSFNAADWLKRYPNLILMRTFSKAYGLAGLRLGYAMAHPEIIALLTKTALPFTVNQAALAAGFVALNDNDFIDKTLRANAHGQQQLIQGLRHCGLIATPSQTNFLLVDCKRQAQPIYEALLAGGIIVRPLAPYGLPNHLRITIGTDAQNRSLLQALELCLKEIP